MERIPSVPYIQAGKRDGEATFSYYLARGVLMHGGVLIPVKLRRVDRIENAYGLLLYSGLSVIHAGSVAHYVFPPSYSRSVVYVSSRYSPTFGRRWIERSVGGWFP